MNKNYLILGLCGFLAFAACQDELEPQPEQPGKDTPTEVITTGTFTGISYEDETAAAADTKVDYSAKDKVFAATWTKEDCIYVTSAADGDDITLKPYILTGEGGKAVGTFEGEEISGTTFSAVYSRTGAAVTEDKTQIAVEFPSTQTYIADGIESHIVPMYAVSNSSSLKFKYGSGIIRLNLWNAEPVTVTKIEIVTDVPAAGTMLVHPADEKFPCGYSVGGGQPNEHERRRSEGRFGVCDHIQYRGRSCPRTDC